MKKAAGILFVFTLISMISIAQNESFIYRENGKLYKDCEEFYPLIMNYNLFYEDSAGTYRVVPQMNQCEQVRGCNSCGTSRADYRKVIVSHLNTITEMGFNTVRVLFLTLRYDGTKDANGKLSGGMVTSPYYKFNMKNPDCHKFIKDGRPVEGIEDFTIQGDLIEELFDIIREEEIPLKVMLLTGSEGVEVGRNLYVKYLEYLADRFSDEPILFAYDLYNEPHYAEEIVKNDYDKYDRANWFYSWYKAIKERSPWHFVTYGPVLTDVFTWDPEVMTTDFFAYHIYSSPKESCNWSYDSAFITYRTNLEYVSRNFTRPWMLGETGMSGVNRELYDKTIHRVIRTEEEQRQFVENSLKYSKWYGAQGYALWKFKDGIWSFNKLNSFTANQYFMGAVNFRENNDWKAAAYEFKKFDPFASITTCSNPDPDQYYNAAFYPYKFSTGQVYLKTGENNRPVPFKDALIRITVGIPGDSKSDYSSITYSDENGKFTVFAKSEDKRLIIKQMRASAPAMNQYYKSNWNKGLSLQTPIYLSPLDQNKLPSELKIEDEKTIARKEVIWDRKRVLQEKTLVIKNGASLTITDTLYVMPGARIIVKDGAKLMLKGAIIGLCKWEGIDVHQGTGTGKKGKDLGGDVVMGKGSILQNSRYNIRKLNSNVLLERDENK